MRDLKRGATLHIQFTEVDPTEGTYVQLGEMVIEPNPESAERFPGMVASLLVRWDDFEAEQTTSDKIIGFVLRRTYLDMAAEAMKRLGFISHG